MTTAPLRRRWLLLVLLLTACAPKAPRTPGETVSGGRANLLSQEEIRRSSITNVYDLVSTLRPRWIQTRGADSFQRPSTVQVYVDNARLSAGLDGLRSLSSIGVSKIEFVAPIDASARWGLDHGQGAIVVTTAGR